MSLFYVKHTLFQLIAVAENISQGVCMYVVLTKLFTRSNIWFPTSFHEIAQKKDSCIYPILEN